MIQERYGKSREEAEKMIDDWMAKLTPETRTKGAPGDRRIARRFFI